MIRERATVVLVHGLWMNGLVMTWLARRLAARGFTTLTLTYPSLRRGLEAHVARLAARLAPLRGVVHLVGHSMGGIVCLRYLRETGDGRVRRVVLLGSPVRGTATGRRLAAHPAGRALLGASARLWLSAPELEVDSRYEVATIAGTRRFGLGAVFSSSSEPGDGVVGVTEARYPGARDELVLPVSHSGMLFSPVVARQVGAFLETGRFTR